jgi:hypothetical protein
MISGGRDERGLMPAKIEPHAGVCPGVISRLTILPRWLLTEGYARSAMKRLKWNHDADTAYWAKRLPLPLTSTEPQEQYDGRDYPLWEDTWKKYILDTSFPGYCHYPEQRGHLLCSPDNIIRCFRDGKVLEALALTVAWGTMVRTQEKIYTKSKPEIERTLLECLRLTEETNSVEDPWNLLVNDLHWSAVIASKCLHFLARSLGYETNPPVPIDNAVILKQVWPKFKRMIKGQRTPDDPPVCQRWRSRDASWDPYNRYMTAIVCWSGLKAWTTTELENTVFKEYRQT